ncbi:MAG: hydroxymethylpyrimidine kinase / phosphomethylpyrimidine kinase / thiamine-phosphate diphosphorylase [Methanothermococcus sp.]|uniref:bifunctional hydroxymethylpyrimidine kinase/phosphomethylpyrimidine kinase n=1 Tax=Methanothermococcus TaxID=155862 RepID=UPI000365B878|nr:MULTISPECIES: bifunctional hydroxymethylpyrimidine kinase/phosphomethylpyrimidine kinase [Methanothermococcus]MDK2790323.1 hydroxymethylpyrimidine kinase / phosphomethylpyrimidine kinase / thiamine-phosphate diphosphorylase [Methanothermococcus sp.]MDK2987141.1 hydroxymethylpyrimidine kinase / phosphomethylpyrimidine kinase / thiamine-phosphate diphosphorylase [Methanothermococcus sp.]
MTNVLAIGGYDPTGGAGIVADAKTIKVLECNPLTIITSIIPQNSLKVYNKTDLPRDEIKNQLDAIFEDFEVSIVKTGVLTKDSIDLILEFQKKYGFKVVCDPVIKSTTNYEFVDNELMDKYLELFKKSYLITPNKEEYEYIMKFIKDKDLNDFKETHVLVTGVKDRLQKFDGKEIFAIQAKKIEKEVHGTGCVFSSAIASFLSKGCTLTDSIKEAKKLVLSSVIYAEKTKYGYNSNPTYINKKKVIDNINYAVYLLKKMDFSLVPEVGSNIAESLVLPDNYHDVAALTGRIIRNKLGGFYIVGDVEFGASEHIAKIILAANQFNPKIRACMNIKYDDVLVKKLEEGELGFKVSSFNRKDEPPMVSSMEWGTKTAFTNYILNNDLDPAKEEVKLDIVYDRGGDGKEPMIRVLGYDAVDVIKKVQKIEEYILTNSGF